MDANRPAAIGGRTSSVQQRRHHQNPMQGVVTHHRGAYLNSLANALSWGPMPMHCAFLHIVPMFHCNGWCFPWVITALAGTHVCTRWVRADLMCVRACVRACVAGARTCV